MARKLTERIAKALTLTWLGVLLPLAACGPGRMVSAAQAQEGPVTRIVAEIKFCKVDIPTECRIIEIVPAGGREPSSIMECARGVSMAAAEFTFEGERWFTKGGTCKEESSAYLAWKQAHQEAGE